MEQVLSEVCFFGLPALGLLGPLFWFSRYIARTDKKMDRIEKKLNQLCVDVAVIKSKIGTS